MSTLNNLPYEKKIYTDCCFTQLIYGGEGSVLQIFTNIGILC